MKRHVEAWGAVVILALYAVAVWGCAGAKHDEAEAVHALQLANCVDQSGNRAAADACTNRVQAAWGRLPDGGRAPEAGK